MSAPDIDAREPTAQNRRNARNVSSLFAASPVTIADPVQSASLLCNSGVWPNQGHVAVKLSHSSGYVILHLGCHPLRFLISLSEPELGFSACESTVL